MKQILVTLFLVFSLAVSYNVSAQSTQQEPVKKEKTKYCKDKKKDKEACSTESRSSCRYKNGHRKSCNRTAKSCTKACSTESKKSCNHKNGHGKSCDRTAGTCTSGTKKNCKSGKIKECTQK